MATTFRNKSTGKPIAGRPVGRIGPKVKKGSSPPTPMAGIRITMTMSGTSDSVRIISIPRETPFNREIFLALEALPHKAPDEPDPE